MIITVLLFILGLVLLIKGGDWFVDSSTSIAHRLHMSELIIGATVVSIGTTLPEVMVSATSALGGHGEIAYGNAIGSVICNTALIAGLTVAIRPSEVNKKNLSMPVIFFFLTAAFYAATAYTARYFNRITGIALLLVFVIYIAYSIMAAKKAPAPEQTEKPVSDSTVIKDILLLIAGAAMIAFGADLLVEHGTTIARYMKVPESVIALTFVALGTSLPELVTAVTSLVKGHGLLSLGNIIGANLFNLVLVSGMSMTLSPFPIPAGKTYFGINGSLLVDIPFMLITMAILCFPALKSGKLKRSQGIILLAMYSAFCVIQFVF